MSTSGEAPIIMESVCRHRGPSACPRLLFSNKKKLLEKVTAGAAYCDVWSLFQLRLSLDTFEPFHKAPVHSLHTSRDQVAFRKGHLILQIKKKNHPSKRAFIFSTPLLNRHNLGESDRSTKVRSSGETEEEEERGGGQETDQFWKALKDTSILSAAQSRN